MDKPIPFFEPNNLDFNPEDLTVGIYFDVELLDRGSASPNHYTGEVLLGSNRVNFLGGEDNVLNTSYTDITILELTNGGDTESIGIESINIKYNTWYFPEINIKFVDVRGNSVFNPMEKANDPSTKKVAKGSFLSCLFAFPYPIFKLTIKGYYGKPVTYKLSVKDLRGQFNSKTGNFEMSVNFIGYMYSYLTDVPMSLLFAAPYINYDNIDSELGVFSRRSTESGQRIPTFVDFIKQMSEGNKTMENSDELNNCKNALQDCTVVLTYIENILSEYRQLSYTLERYFDLDESTKNFIEDEEVNEVFFTYSETKVNKHKNTQYNTSIDDLVTVINGAISGIKSYWERIKNNNVIKSKITSDLVITTENRVYMVQRTQIGQEYLLESDGTTPAKRSIKMNYVSDLKVLNELKETVKSIKEYYVERQNDEVKNAYNSILSWQPTIINFFEITIAHLNKFYENMSRCIDNINNSSSERSLKQLNGIETDINAHSDDVTVYPFPAFYDNEKKNVWIGDVPNARNYKERDFIEDLIKGTLKSKETMEKAISDYELSLENTTTFPYNGIPTLLYDLNNGHPYKVDDISAEGLCSGDMPIGVKIFAKRLMLRRIYNSNYSDDKVTTMIDAKTFGELEALNFLHAVGNYEAIKQSSCFTTSNLAANIQKYIKQNAVRWFGRVPDSRETYSPPPCLRRIRHDDLKDDVAESADINSELNVPYYIDDESSGTTDGCFRNCFNTIDIQQYSQRLEGIGNYVNSETYHKVFPSVPNIEERIKSYLVSPDKSRGILSNSSLYEELTKVAEVTDDSDTTDEKIKSTNITTGKNISLGDFSFESNSDIDFFPLFSKYTDKNQYTKKSFDTLITKKNTWWSNLWNTNEESEYYFSFSCKKYWDIETETWLTAQQNDDIYHEILRDFLYSIGMNYYISPDIKDLLLIENGGISEIPMIKILSMGLGFRNDSLEITEENKDRYSRYFKSKSTDIGKFIIDFYEKNYKRVVNDLVNYVLDDTNYNKVSNGGIKTISTEKNRKIYFVRILSKSAKEKLLQLFNEQVYLFSLHGKHHREPQYEDKAITFFETSEAVGAFIDKVRDMVGLNTTEEQPQTSPTETDVNVIRKMGFYDTVKNLYDRWKFGAYRQDGNGMYTSETKVTIDNFVFRNGFNQDISNTLTVNADKFIKAIDSIYKGDSNMSVYDFLHNICGIADCLMLSLPVNIFDSVNSMEKMKEMFSPHNYITARNDSEKSTFVVTYRSKESEHLAFHPNTSQYKDDGVDFTNYTVKEDNNNLGNNMGVFGVSYGLNSQRFFKDVSVSMDKPRVTEQSIAATLQIVSEGDKTGSSGYGRVYHDLFDTYSKHSYNCTVEMMGNAQLMPMLYFQLNNIPLFKGGYIIVNVEHNINSQGMTTTFIGNRMTKYQFNLMLNGIERDMYRDDDTSSTDEDRVAGGNSARSSVEKYKGELKNIEKLNYSKEKTKILLDAGHYMAISGKQSPDLNPETGMFPMDYEERSGDGSLNPNDTSGSNTYRYREYWGCRKIASQLYQKLKDNGYDVEMVFSNSKDAKNYSSFTSKVNEIYENQKRNGGSTIIVSLHSNAAANSGWGGGNYWCIYKQSVEYVEKDGKWYPAYHPETSDLLAQCIADAATKVFAEVDMNKFLPQIEKGGSIQKMSVHNKPKTFEDRITSNGIRPTTYSHAPTVLSENLFHDTKSHVEFLAKKEGRDAIVKLHYDGIEEFFRKVK